MAAELFKILDAYAAFETAVRRQIAELCAPHCSVCERVCCQPQFCRENVDSPFLTLLSAKTLATAAYSAHRGWLTSKGCALSAGRPPVCYQFSCNQILNAQPDDQHRFRLRVLSNLVPHIGKRALGGRHLVEIMDPAQLEKVRFKRFARRLGEARRALQVIRSSQSQGLAAPAAREILLKIIPIPRSLAG